MDAKQASGLTFLGGVLMAIGSFLTWASVSASGAGAASKSGTEGGDGWITLVIGIALIAAGFMAYSGKALPMWFGWAAAILGVAVAVFEFFSLKSDLDDFNAVFEGTGVSGSLGIGFWLVVAGALLGIIGVAMGRSKKMA